jgi:hypothetical protein
MVVHTFLDDPHHESLPEDVKNAAYEDETFRVLTDRLEDSVRNEFPVLATRLQVERETVYNDYDRLRSEAELRFSIFTPLIALTVIMAMQWSAFTLFAIVIPIWLVGEAWRRQRLAEAKVWDSLAMGLISSPTLEGLDRWSTEFASLPGAASSAQVSERSPSADAPAQH